MVGTKTLICGVWFCGVWIAIGSAEAGPPGASDAGPPVMLDESPPGLVEPAFDAADAEALPARFAVTGSLIERATLTTPSPLTILRRDDLLAAGRSMIGDVLQPLPEQGNALNAQVNNGGDGSTRLSLRSLEPGRTLVLLDGRRFVPGGQGADSAVDLNTIPLAVIDRVEVLKDGASPIYGSAAVGGVVNLITRNRFEGTEATVYTGESSRKDGFTFDASFITGRRFADGRGHVVFSAGTQRQDPVFAGDREYSKVTNVFDFSNGTIIPSGSPATPNGRINAKRIDLNGDGIPDPINLCGANVQFCTLNGAGGFRPFQNPGDLFNFQPDNYLYTPSARGNAYTAGSFALGPSSEGFFEASFLHRASDQRLASEPLNLDLTGAPISRFSIYNPIGGDVLSYNRRLQ
ncbi:MAG TPA: TonB-dependent receptor plug domain-containing protein, partial [Kofleriaceae bacterium]|nr:TonB-dependent receptor plug domain-containing protein [Kofleriaceae bacterium]